jgi:hypothetical protein
MTAFVREWNFFDSLIKRSCTSCVIWEFCQCLTIWHDWARASIYASESKHCWLLNHYWFKQIFNFFKDQTCCFLHVFNNQFHFITNSTCQTFAQLPPWFEKKNNKLFCPFYSTLEAILFHLISLFRFHFNPSLVMLPLFFLLHGSVRWSDSFPRAWVRSEQQSLCPNGDFMINRWHFVGWNCKQSHEWELKY